MSTTNENKRIASVELQAMMSDAIGPDPEKESAAVSFLCNHAFSLAEEVLELREALFDTLRYLVTPTGFKEKGKGRTEQQQAAFDRARTILSKTNHNT